MVPIARLCVDVIGVRRSRGDQTLTRNKARTASPLSPVLEAFERNNLGAASGVSNEEADIVVLSK